MRDAVITAFEACGGALISVGAGVTVWPFTHGGAFAVSGIAALAFGFIAAFAGGRK